MEDPKSNEVPKKPDDGGGILGQIIKDTWKQIVIPKSMEILNNAATDGVYAIADFLTNVIGKRIFGPDAKYQSRSSNQSRTNYNAMYQQQSRTSQQNNNQQQQKSQNIGLRSSTDLKYVVVYDQKMAEEWKKDLINSIERYGYVTVATLYEKTQQLPDEIELTNGTVVKPTKIPPVFPDFEYGWNRIEDIHYVRNRDGYHFNLPTPVKVR